MDTIMTVELFAKELEVFIKEGKGEWKILGPLNSDSRFCISPKNYNEELCHTVNECFRLLLGAIEEGKNNYIIEYNPETKMIEANKPIQLDISPINKQFDELNELSLKYKKDKEEIYKKYGIDKITHLICTLDHKKGPKGSYFEICNKDDDFITVPKDSGLYDELMDRMKAINNPIEG